MSKLHEIFEATFRENRWGDAESRSGTGSNNHQTRHLQTELPILLKELGVHSLCDVPCGDFNWMKHVDLEDIIYIGGDIVPEIVDRNQATYGNSKRTFRQMDITSIPLPQVDAILCRDCLVHLPLADIFKALGNICASGSTYLITTTFSYRSMPANHDCAAGDWRRLDFEIAPFDFPPPIRRLIEGTTEVGGAYSDKSLGIWPITQVSNLLSKAQP